MADFKCLVWNCTGLRDSTATSQNKALYFEKEHKNDFTVAFFIETHHKSENEISKEILRYQGTHHIVHTAASDKEPYSGIIGLVRKDYDIIEQNELIQGRILNLKIEHSSSKAKHNISAVYLDTNNHITKAKIEKVVSCLRGKYDDHPNNIIVGDFNFIGNEKDKRNGLNEKDKLACKYWNPFLAEMDMVDPFREQNPNRRIWSFIGTGRAGNSRIDRIYCNAVCMKNITNIKYTPTMFGGHKIMSFKVKAQNEKGKGYYKMNTSILKDERYRKIVEETKEKIDAMQIQDPIEKWETFLMTIKTVSISYSQNKSKIKRNLKQQLVRKLSQIEEEPSNLENNLTLEEYNKVKEQLKKMEEEEIEGYKIRVKYLAQYERGEPGIQNCAKLEKKKIAEDTIGQLAETKDSTIYTDKQNIMRIATKFYQDLYTPCKVNTEKQNKLLRNIKTQITREQKHILDAPITLDEVQTAIRHMKPGKSPGLDGIPVEFYQEYWGLIMDDYMAFITKVITNALPKGKNASAIKIIFKKNGEIYLLCNYRPISLINVDIKIITKVLANRLKYILPTIIHVSQTAVYGRRIDQTVHLIRDLIDLANKEDETAAFIFLDQEKAFDRVNHTFLYKTMRAFGIGEGFIQWVMNIYSTASAVLNINGFLSDPIPLKRGVRQGCPLSLLLYLLVIEVFAIQMRLNPNIIGFTIGGEKIISAHYVDDATIIIKQNRCFKEVIKEMTEYEEASGAKINYKKTKGLWAGSWKGRRLSPMDIKWTSKNVYNLGIFFGNDDPATDTFNEIAPKFMKRLNYWKQFHFSQIGKSRVLEIFMASKLVYAIKFYPIPSIIQKNLQKAIFDFMTFPRKVVTIEQKELWKTKDQGGIKLPNIQIKSEASKAKWITEIVSNPDFETHLVVFTKLLGTQKGGISGKHLAFLQKSYFQYHLKTKSSFYKEALLAMANLETRKGIPNIHKWDTEHVFYNPLFTKNDGKTLTITKYCEREKIFILEQLYHDKIKENQRRPFNKVITNLYDKIILNTSVRKHDILIATNGEEIKLEEITHKQLYEQMILKSNTLHHSQIKWFDQLQIPIVWEEVWKTVHNTLSTYETKSVIWEQIHLNFYTQYSYNKWHAKNEICPLCHKIPDNIYHIMLFCDFSVQLWNDIEAVLKQLHNAPISNEEKAFGVVQKNLTPGPLVRNWLTYLLREFIAEEERRSYHTKKKPNLQKAKRDFNYAVKWEIRIKLLQYEHSGNTDKLDKIITHGDILCKKGDDEQYQIRDIFPMVA